MQTSEKEKEHFLKDIFIRSFILVSLTSRIQGTKNLTQRNVHNFNVSINSRLNAYFKGLFILQLLFNYHTLFQLEHAIKFF